MRSFRVVVAPFAGAIIVIFSILVGFLANDVWDRNRRAAATVRGEDASLISLHALATASGTPHFAIDRAIRAYAAAVINPHPGGSWGEIEVCGLGMKALTCTFKIRGLGPVIHVAIRAERDGTRPLHMLWRRRSPRSRVRTHGNHPLRASCRWAWANCACVSQAAAWRRVLPLGG